MNFSTVFIAGSGFMGSAIGYLIASKTASTIVLYDLFPESLEKARASIDKIITVSSEKGFLLPDKKEQIKKQLKFSTSLQDAAQAQLVIEAIAENIEAKKSLFRELDGICPAETIFASNTSSLPITSLAAATKRTSRFLGMHFFSPAHIMKLLELIPGLDTDPEVLETVKNYGSETLGKTIITSGDLPGFITTRLGMVLCNEAAFALMEGLSTAEEIDKGMTLGYNHPMGPLALADFVGLDILLHIMETMHEGFGDPKYRPCPLIKQLVSAGHLGRKTGRGFYTYQTSKTAVAAR